MATRRAMVAAAGVAAWMGFGRGARAACTVGPPVHPKGPLVFLDYDQTELDAAYTQPMYEPNFAEVNKRAASNSAIARQRLGAPRRVAYGPGAREGLDIFAAKRVGAPILVFIHGGAWRAQTAADYAFVAEPFVAAGVHVVIPDFAWVQEAGGDLRVLADQVRRAVSWVYGNAGSFGGDAGRIYVSGHSSGGHLAGVLLTTDWVALGLPPTVIRGGVCISGMFDLTPVRLSARSSYVRFDDAMVEALSPIRHLDRLSAPLVVTYGTNETPEFQRQSRDFAAAVKAAGKPVELVVAEGYYHLEMAETLGNPFGAAGFAALRMIGV